MLETGSALTQAIDLTNDPKTRYDNELHKDPLRLREMIKDKKVEVIRVGTNRFVTENSDVQKNLRTLNTTTNQILGVLDQMGKIQTSGFSDTNKRNEFERLYSSLLPLTSKKFGLGTLDEGLQSFMGRLLKGISYDAIISDPQKAISGYQNQVNSEFENFANSAFSGNQDYTGIRGVSSSVRAKGKALE
jgi:hypothetical protein